mmetsp:Transcript_14458/g.29592  ORF Transcript_14458/g.29592 Transcript_14458/m.29592 type:complete len:579 (-) Transcript_14458:1826-3562(-)
MDPMTSPVTRERISALLVLLCQSSMIMKSFAFLGGNHITRNVPWEPVKQKLAVKFPSKAYSESTASLRSTIKRKQTSGEESKSPNPSIMKSPESTFWISIPQSNKKTITDGSDDFAVSDGQVLPIPAISKIDLETGPLPPGAYQTVEQRENGRDALSKCVIGVGINPPTSILKSKRKSGDYSNYGQDGNEVWRVGVKNTQKLIDSGFNTFRMNSCDLPTEKKEKNVKRKSHSTFALEKMQKHTLRSDCRHEAEKNFYDTLRRDTPSSVLRTCNFITYLDIPSLLSVDDPFLSATFSGGKRSVQESSIPYGNGWIVRKSVSDALLRTKGECLDTIILEYREKSPYHLDVLNTLFEMKEEGLLRSISTCNFPPSLLRSASKCGFEIRSNDVHGSLLNTRNLQPFRDPETLNKESDNISHLVSAPLGGGLLTENFSFASLGDLSRWSSQQRKKCEELLNLHARGNGYSTKAERMNKFQSIMTTLEGIAVKYQTSVAAVSVRFLLQLKQSAGDSIVVGTSLGMDFVEEQGGQPYRRGKDLRQVFTFSLEDDDMKQIFKVSGLSREIAEHDHVIDFSNKRLWL